jgi:serine/threonine protein kinase/tetratricopeptide (TPR) repeat protein
MTDPKRSPSLPPGLAVRINPVCDRFEEQWLAGAAPRLEEFLALVDEPDRPALLRELLDLELHYRCWRDERPTAEEYRQRLPKHAEVIASIFAATGLLPNTLLQTEDSAASTGGGGPPPGAVSVPGYEILGELGRGAMGVVYRARQVGLNRVVALKMILAGSHAGPALVIRFRTEVETVARLQHPHIVQIYEVGAAGALPYCTLEFCDGGTLAGRLRGGPLPAAEAARLVEKLARAMHAAHQAGVVHRDLKPANILLQEDLPQRRKGAKEDSQEEGGQALPATSSAFAPLRLCGRSFAFVPKITDFGLAKSLDADDGQTRSGDLVGTPSYMAPEQARGSLKEIGPATDVYALGAILYECLTGRPPFKAATLVETLDLVRNAEPVPPRQLQPRCPRDLETVCLKCLAKDSRSRYGTAAAMAEDLARFLRGEPVTARPTGPLGRAWRWCSRNPAVAALLAVVAFLLLAVTGVSAAFAIHAGRQRQKAEELAANLSKALTELQREKGEVEKQQEERQKQLERAEKAEVQTRVEAERAREVSGFLLKLFKDADPIALSLSDRTPGKTWGPKLRALELVDRGRERLRTELRKDPAARAAVLQAMSEVYVGLGRFKDAQALLEEALELTRDKGDDHLDTAACRHALGTVLHHRGDYERARPLLEEALRVRLLPRELSEEERRKLQFDIDQSKFHLAWLLSDEKEFARAEALFQEVVAFRRRLPPAQDHDLVVALLAVAAMKADQGETLAALEPLREAVGILHSKANGEAVLRGWERFLTGMVYREMHLYTPAVEAMDESLRIARQQGAEDLPMMAFVHCERARTLEEAKRNDEAVKGYRDCLDLLKRTVGLQHPKAIEPVWSLAGLLVRRGDVAGARQLYEEMLQARLDEFKEGHLPVAHARFALAVFERQHGSPEKAGCLLDQAIGTCNERKATPQWLPAALGLRAVLLEREGLAEKAEAYYRKALALTIARGDDRHDAISLRRAQLAVCLLRQDKLEEAGDLLSQAREAKPKAVEARISLASGLALWHRARREFDPAQEQARLAVKLARTQYGGDAARTRPHLELLAAIEAEARKAAP